MPPFLKDRNVINRITVQPELTFIAVHFPTPQIIWQELLIAAEEREGTILDKKLTPDILFIGTHFIYGLTSVELRRCIKVKTILGRRGNVKLIFDGQDDKKYVRLEHLLKSYNTRVAHIEFTSRCNLRCVFCAVSQPEYKGKDLEFYTIDDLIRVLIKRKIKVVSVNGHGETTILPNWYKYCDKMLELGIDLHIISNFAKTFSKE